MERGRKGGKFVLRYSEGECRERNGESEASWQTKKYGSRVYRRRMGREKEKGRGKPVHTQKHKAT